MVTSLHSHEQTSCCKPCEASRLSWTPSGHFPKKPALASRSRRALIASCSRSDSCSTAAAFAVCVAITMLLCSERPNLWRGTGPVCPFARWRHRAKGHTGPLASGEPLLTLQDVGSGYPIRPSAAAGYPLPSCDSRVSGSRVRSPPFFARPVFAVWGAPPRRGGVPSSRKSRKAGPAASPFTKSEK